MDIHKESRQEKLLKQLCPKSNDCVILGKHIELLKEYFNDFKDIDSPRSNLESIHRIGNPSVNGFVNEFIYNKNDYKAYCVLKSSSQDKSDNLYFEWYIGNYFINRLVPKFPCFLETYNLCNYSFKTYNLLKNTKLITKPNLDNFTILKTSKLEEGKNTITVLSWLYPTNIAVLIQHMDNPMTFTNFIKIHENTEYGFNVDIFQIFLQIFIPLGKLAHNFTHNDLHLNNVLIYTFPDNKYIVLKYIFKDKVIEMKTRYIAKIIDYGRSYFNFEGLPIKTIKDNSSNSSAIFYQDLKECLISDFKKHNLNINDDDFEYEKDDHGYGWFEDLEEDNYYISQLNGNISKDLWLPGIFCEISEKFSDNIENEIPITKELKELFNFVLRANKNIMRIPPNEDCNVITFGQGLCNIYLNNIDYINQKQNIEVTGICVGQLDIFVDDLSKDSKFTSETSKFGGKLKKKNKKNKTKKSIKCSSK